MLKKYVFLLISLFTFAFFIISCTSPLGNAGLKFKDRKGIYQDNSKNITVEVTTADNQNLIIKVQNYNGIITDDVYDITSTVTTGKFTLKSKSNENYIYIVDFYGNNSVIFSVRKGSSYPINNQELKNTK